MKFSKRTNQYAYSIVSNYSKLDREEGQYLLSYCDVPDFELHKLATCIYMDNPGFATESTGPDNYYYERTMMPALLSLLKDSTDKDRNIDFIDCWRDGVTAYAEDTMKELINDMLNNFNEDHLRAA